ncbi:MAG: hypothetical protein JWN82_483 [Candidatus Saccharibacteria bacterium]|nr:hypothetical protein [Candidatus Saccharibacteria bacterium]
MLNKLNKFHDSKPGYAAFAVFGLVIAYVFISYAIDSGSWFDYLIALLAIIVFLQNLAKLVGGIVRRG